MNLTKTQEFVYFQNKARHYHNLRKIKPAIKTHRDPRSQSTIEDYHRTPYFQRYDMERQNEGIINRISNIMNSDKAEVQKHGYTRYNAHFVPRSHLTIELRENEKSIDLGNHHLAQKVLNIKPSIGTIENWNVHFHQNQERKKSISKYTDKRTSKGTLNLYPSSSFLPEHYRSFLGGSLNKRELQQNNQSPEQMPIHVKIKVEQLFQLPKLKRMRGSSTRLDQ